MTKTQSTTSDAHVLKEKDWAEGLAHIGLTNMLFMPHFVYSIQINTYMKQLLVYFHGGYLWLDHPYLVNVELIGRIIGLQAKEKIYCLT